MKRKETETKYVVELSCKYKNPVSPGGEKFDEWSDLVELDSLKSARSMIIEQKQTDKLDDCRAWRYRIVKITTRVIKEIVK